MILAKTTPQLPQPPPSWSHVTAVYRPSPSPLQVGLCCSYLAGGNYVGIFMTHPCDWVTSVTSRLPGPATTHSSRPSLVMNQTFPKTFVLWNLRQLQSWLATLSDYDKHSSLSGEIYSEWQRFISFLWHLCLLRKLKSIKDKSCSEKIFQSLLTTVLPRALRWDKVREETGYEIHKGPWGTWRLCPALLDL